MVDKEFTVDIAVTALEKKYGKGVLWSLGPGEDPLPVERLDTGSLKLNHALGGGYGKGGYGLGRIIEVFGDESSGKTTLCLHAIVAAQAQGKLTALIDAEHAFDPIYASDLGIDLAQLKIAQPSSGDEALDIADYLTRTNAFSLIVVDSVASLVPKAELEGEITDSHVGLQARMMSQALRRLAGLASRTDTTIIFVNQLRMKIGVMFGNPWVTSGGNALKFYASQRVELKKSTKVKNTSTGEVVTQKINVKIVKNKLAPPFKQTQLDIMFGRGVCPEAETLELALEHNIVSRAGAWYSYGETRIGQGAGNVINHFIENPEIYREIRGKLVEQID